MASTICFRFYAFLKTKAGRVSEKVFYWYFPTQLPRSSVMKWCWTHFMLLIRLSICVQYYLLRSILGVKSSFNFQTFSNSRNVDLFLLKLNIFVLSLIHSVNFSLFYWRCYMILFICGVTYLMSRNNFIYIIVAL